MSCTFTPPPVSGPTPIPEYLLRVGQAHPDRELVCFIQDARLETNATTTSITWRQFLADVWVRTSYIAEVTGFQWRVLGKESVVVGLLAESTYNFLVTLVALLILRWQVLLISVRNSPDAILHLLRTTKCTAVLIDAAICHLHPEVLRADTAIGVTPIVVARALPSSDKTRDGTGRAAAFLQESALHAAMDLKKEAEGGALFLHTSGSTGHPKPISWSHEFVLALSAGSARERAHCDDDVLYTCFPMFHAGGVCLSFPFLLGSGASFVCLDQWHSISVDTILRHLRILKRAGRKVDASLPPSMLEEIADAAETESVAVLAAQNAVMWGGAPLRESAGDYLVQNGVRLIAWGGCTEAGTLARSSFEEGADLMDWPYMRIVDYYEFHWYPMEGDCHDKYNLIVSPKYATPPILNSSDPLGFATVDGWQRHPDPSKSHLWKLVGRLDDVTVLSNGEKTDNKQLEELLCLSRDICHALIFGTGQFVNGAIIEPPTSTLTDSSDAVAKKYLDAIWPHIEGHVNSIVPRHSRLLRDMVIVARPDRPFPISDKGTVKTKDTLALYKDDIQRAYDVLNTGAAASSPASAPPRLTISDTAATEVHMLDLVQNLVRDALGRALAPTEDFFRHGLDSHSATRVRAALAASLRDAGIPTTLPRNTVYAYPTCAALTRRLVTLTTTAAQSDAREEAETYGSAVEVPVAEIERLVAAYTKDLPRHSGKRTRVPRGEVYAVTGTTGSLGAAFVARLLERDNVKKVYLLNRGQAGRSMAERQESSFRDKGLDCAALHQARAEGRIEYVKIDVSKERFGLPSKAYKKLASQVTHVVHNAWLLNFNLFLSSFEPHIAGVRAVLDLALASPHGTPPHVTFVSSIGAVARWPFGDRPVPEAMLDVPEFSLPQGYAYSKYAAEQILQRAAALRPTLRIAIVRCGQVAGALTTGAWARSEYIPRLLRSADALGMVPIDIKPVHWLPVDVAADILLREVTHAAAQRSPHPPLYYSLENARETPWPHVVDALKSLRPDRLPQEVSLAVFLDAVRKDSGSAASEVADVLEQLLGTYPVPCLTTSHARAAAGDRVDCALGGELLSRYVKYACA